MTHPELEFLASDYLEGQLETTRRTQVDAHLAECAGCREMIADLRRTMDLCHSAEDLEPAPWLVPKILLATVGQKKPRLREQLVGFLRPALHPRVASVVAMAVFSFSIIVNAAGLNLRNLKPEDLNPRTWLYRANRTGHLLYARAEKFYYDLRVVYEIESRFRRLRAEPQEQENKEPRREAPPGGTTDGNQPNHPQLASAHDILTSGPAPREKGRSPSL